MGKILEILNGDDSCEELDKLRVDINNFAEIKLKKYIENTKKYCQFPPIRIGYG